MARNESEDESGEVSPTPRWWSLLCACGLVLGAPALAATPVASEFQVNSFTPGYQYIPEVAVAADGSFVVVWASNGQDSSDTGIFGQRHHSNGAKVGAEFQVNSYTSSFQSYPRVAADADGDFVVVWHSTQQEGTTALLEVFGQRYASSGVRQGSEFQVNTFTVGAQSFPAVAMDDDGDFVVVWASNTQFGGIPGIFGQRFASSGGAAGSQFLVTTYTTTQLTPAVAMEGNGDFVVTWDSLQDGSGFGVFGQRWSSSGTKVGVEFAVNTYTSGAQYGSALGIDADGDFVVIWSSNGQNEAMGSSVIGQRFDSAGARQGVEFQVNSYNTGYQYTPVFAPVAPRAVGMDPDGDFVVVWTSYGQDSTDRRGVFGQAFDSAGVKVGVELQINTHTIEHQSRPAVGMDADGDFVVVWYGADDQDGEGYGVFGQRFAAGGGPTDKILDVDLDGSVAALTDGLLVLRQRFGFTGAPLIAGAVADACTRCEAGPIAAYIVSILGPLDIDVDGEVEALTDGLLILRRLFGFSGATLINGAVDIDCTRCEAGPIADHIDSLR